MCDSWAEHDDDTKAVVSEHVGPLDVLRHSKQPIACQAGSEL